MITQTIDLRHFDQKTEQIRNQVSMILKKWGLLPRFSRWRLAQDPDTGMVVLFGVLNKRYLAMHTVIPFRDYFDPRVLHDLSNQLQVQVVSCNGDSLRYAFILDRGQLGKLPTHIDFPFVNKGRLLVRVVYSDDQLPVVPLPPERVVRPDDLTFVRQVTAAFLKVFEDIKLQDDATLRLSAQNPPDIVIIDEFEFNKRVAEHEVNRQRVKHISRLLGKTAGKL